ncbi:MAG: hypothetical protein B6D79_16895, partial [gamma proteobacterium symbiont of Ctena orbiculata]
MSVQAITLLLGLLLGLVNPALSQSYHLERSPQMEQKLKAAYIAKGIAYRPRTEHFKEDGSPRY